jgi:hypothetical protein
MNKAKKRNEQKAVSKDILYKAMTSNLQTFKVSPNVINFGRVTLQKGQGQYVSTVELHNVSELAARFRLRTAAFASSSPAAAAAVGVDNKSSDVVTVGTNGLKFNEMISSTSIPLKLSFKPRGAVPVNGSVSIKVEVIMNMLSELYDIYEQNEEQDNNDDNGGGGKLLQQDYDDPFQNGVKNLSYAMVIVAEHQEIVIPINMQVVVPLARK